MNVFGSDITARENYQMNNRGNAGMNSLRETLNADSVSRMEAVKTLLQGQVFQGEILDITSRNVTIRLDNQQVIQARLGESMELNIGQKMLFEVKEQQGEQVFIRPVDEMNTGGHSPAAEKALSANGFSFSERNLQIADELLKAGMPLDKESMRKVMQQSMKYPDADIKTLVSMNQLGIPVNDSNLAQYDKYMNYEHQVTNNIQSMIHSLADSILDMAQNGTTDDVKQMNQQLIDIFGWNKEVIEEPGKEAVNDDHTSGQMISPDYDGPNQKGAATKIDVKLLRVLEQELRDLGFPDEQVKEVLNSSKEYCELFSNLHQMLMEEDGFPETVVKDAAKKLFSSPVFHELIKKGIQDEWLMKPEEMKKPQEVDELYHKLLHQSAQLEQSLNSGGSSNQHFSEQAQDMRENIQFMQQLNEQFIFAQLPMNMHGENVNSELFVYANKKKLEQSADGVKVLLHLDMPNLGSTDILVRLKDKKLHAVFTLEDDTAVTLVADNMEELEEKLMKKGFIFTNDVHKSERVTPDSKKDVDPVIEEMLNQDMITGVKRYTFDVRG